MNGSIIAQSAFAFMLAAAAVPGQSRQIPHVQAKVSETDARAAALQRVPDGVVASSELEREHDKLIWSFDIKRPGSNDVTEVQVDAESGVIVSTQTESPAEQAHEAAADAKSHRHD